MKRQFCFKKVHFYLCMLSVIGQENDNLQKCERSEMTKTVHLLSALSWDKGALCDAY